MIVEGWRKAKGDTDDHTISSLAYLQLIYEGLEKWTEATTVAEELLSALLKAGDKGNANIIANGKKLASTLVDHGHNKDAKKLMERIFEVQKQVLGLHNDAMASTIVQLLQLYLYLDCQEDAEELTAWSLQNVANIDCSRELISAKLIESSLQDFLRDKVARMSKRENER